MKEMEETKEMKVEKASVIPAEKESNAGGDSEGVKREDALVMKETAVQAEITGDGFRVVFDKVTGRLTGFEVQGKSLILSGPSMNLWRAPIDNDMYKAADWKEKYFLHRQQEQLEEFVTERDGKDVFVKIRTHFSPLSMAFGFKVCYLWHIKRDGEIGLSLDMEGFRYSSFIPEFIPRIGIEMRLPGNMEHVVWYGLGPDENYCDMKAAAFMGIYRRTVEEMHVEYAKPQENGHREEVRWLGVGDGENSLLICSEKGMGIDVHDYTIEALERARHVGEIQRFGETVVHLDVKHSGVGSNSCGEEQTYVNKTKLNDYSMRLVLKCVENQSIIEESRKIRVKREEHR